MSYIKQKNTNCIVVNPDQSVIPDNELNSHPSILEHSDLFEIIDADLPEKFDMLIYQSEQI